MIDYYDDLRGDVLLWSDVMGKLEYHAMWSVTKVSIQWDSVEHT